MFVARTLGYGGTALVAAGTGYAVYDPTFRAALPTNLDGLNRFMRTSFNVVVTAADYKINLTSKYPDFDPFESDDEEMRQRYKESAKQCNIRAAKRLFRVCKSHGGIYNKFAQYVSTLNHVLPKEAIDIISPLQDKAKQLPKEEAVAAIRAELIKKFGPDFNFDDVFLSFNENAMAAASLAQVHHAVMKIDGNPTEVALKIQYPKLKHQTDGDVSTIRFLATVLGKVFPQFEYTWLVPEFENNLVLELDFLQEARNGIRLKNMFKKSKDVYVPKMHPELSTSKLLIMDFVNGWKIDNIEKSLEEGVDPLKVAKTVATTFGDMIHVHGFVHCDPHAGNLMLRKKEKEVMSWKSIVSLAVSFVSIPLFGISGYTTLAYGGAVISSLGLMYQSSKMQFTGHRFGNNYELVILDHGMYRRLEPEFRRDYCQLWKALLMGDEKLGLETMHKLNIGVKPEDYELFVMSITFRRNKKFASLAPDRPNRLTKEEAKHLREKVQRITMQEVNDFMRKLPRDLLFVMRSSNIIRSINHALGGSGADRFRLMGESAVRGLALSDIGQSEKNLEEVKEAIANYEESHRDLLLHPAYRANLPVESEIINHKRAQFSEWFEIYQLRIRLEILDRLARIVMWIAAMRDEPIPRPPDEVFEEELTAAEDL